MATITEDYCSFDLSKLLKERGFDVECEHYFEDGKVVLAIGASNWNDSIYGGMVSAPTHQMAMKWLREVHGLHIYTFRIGERWHYEIQVFKEGYTCSKVGGDSHDEAIENAIWYCINNLI